MTSLFPPFNRRKPFRKLPYFFEAGRGIYYNAAVAAASFSPSSLFAAGEQGAWYDPSDMSTMFQDAAGTTPVTAVEQPVSRILDKSGRGNHATTPAGATASRPVLSARVNLLTKTEQLDDAAWIKASLTAVNTVATTDPLGGTTAELCYPTSSGANRYFYQAATTVSGPSYVNSIYAKYANIRWFNLTSVRGSTARSAWFDVQNGAVGTIAGGVTASITSVGNGWYRCTVTDTSAATTGYHQTIISSSDNSLSVTANGTDGIYFWGADSRVTNDGVGVPTYQRVNTSTDYDTTNFPMYLRFDGSDDYMLTGTITPGVDKAQVFAGMRKLSDASIGFPMEFSASTAANNGSWHITAPAGTAAPSYGFASKGTTRVDTTVTSYSAPITNVFSGIASISEDILQVRVNGTQVGTSSSDQGTGNYLAYPLYIGRRGGTASPLNGRIYGMIVRFGANLDNTQITNTETWMNEKTKAY